MLKEVWKGVDGAGEEDTEEVGNLLGPLGAAEQDWDATLGYRAWWLWYQQTATSFKDMCETHLMANGPFSQILTVTS